MININAILGVALFSYCLVGMVKLGSKLVFKITYHAINLTGWLAAQGINKGSELIGTLDYLKPVLPFSAAPVILCVSAHGYVSRAQSGLIRYSGNESDSDGDGDADNAYSDKVERDQTHQQGQKRVGKRERLLALLKQIEQLENRILKMEAINDVPSGVQS